MVLSYRTLTKTMGHTGPSDYKGKNLSTFGDRLNYFGYQFRNAGEGAASGGPTVAPEAWMDGDTHFRPWFNIGAEVREIGFGVAKGADGNWYFCKIAGLGAPAAPRLKT